MSDKDVGPIGKNIDANLIAQWERLACDNSMTSSEQKLIFAQCVSEWTVKQLAGVGMEPVATVVLDYNQKHERYEPDGRLNYVSWNTGSTENEKLIPAGTKLHDATQLAAAIARAEDAVRKKDEAAWAVYGKRIDILANALNGWGDKTEWVQETAKPMELGMHRADVLKQRITELESQLAQCKEDAERYQWLREYLISDYDYWDDAIVGAATNDELDGVIDAARQEQA